MISYINKLGCGHRVGRQYIENYLRRVAFSFRKKGWKEGLELEEVLTNSSRRFLEQP